MLPGNNWAQVWLSVPSESNRSACLFWFRTTSSTHVNPNGVTLAHDAAIFFRGAVGYTAEKLENFAYVHAYVLCDDVAPFPIETHGWSAFPGTPPPPPHFRPATQWLTVHRMSDPQPRNAHFSLPALDSDAVGRFVTIDAQARIATLEAALLTGWDSQGRHFQSVVPSYKDGQWYDLLGLRLAPTTGGWLRRQKTRADRLHGNIPKHPP